MSVVDGFCSLMTLYMRSHTMIFLEVLSHSFWSCAYVGPCMYVCTCDPYHMSKFVWVTIVGNFTPLLWESLLVAHGLLRGTFIAAHFMALVDTNILGSISTSPWGPVGNMGLERQEVIFVLCIENRSLNIHDFVHGIGNVKGIEHNAWQFEWDSHEVYFKYGLTHTK